MTEKLFWIDPYQREFDATVTNQFPVADGHAVVLDRTCFYATSGGQPNDLGLLNSVPVQNVRQEGESLVHVLLSPLQESSVHGVIDWQRRFDHMQQHSGQHILSAAFFQLFEAQTSSFHLGEDYCSIELDKPNLQDAQLQQAEELANHVILAATAVNAFFADPQEAKSFPLRKQSDLAESLRIIRIGDFDMSPCSGTHVKNASEISVIFVTGVERLPKITKVIFLCGNRVRSSYQHDLAILKILSKTLTTSFDLIPDTIQKLQSQLKDQRKLIKNLTEDRLKKEASELAEQAVEWNGGRLCVHLWNRPYEEVRYLAQRILEFPGLVGAAASTQENRIVFFKHRDLNLDLRPLFQEFLAKTGVKGGGPPHFMEAGGFENAEIESLLKALFAKG
jgi:alanyl-tRNA synthetase